MVDWGEHVDVTGCPYPPYVSGEDSERRWNVSVLIARACSSAFEPDGEPNPSFVWHTTRTIYHDPTVADGPAAEVDAVIAEARATRGEADSEP